MNKSKILLTGGGIGSLLFASSLFVACSCSSNKEQKSAGPIALVTDAGDINDQSFNQQAWEALQFIQPGSNSNVDVFKPKTTQSNDLYKAYIKAEEAGKKYIFANGYLHQAAIFQYNKEKDDSGISIDQRLKFFLIDEDYFEDKFNDKGLIEQPNKKTHTNVVSFKYDVLPAGHQAGLLVGEYFKAENKKNKKVGFWGGGPFDAVSDFIKGFLSGIQTFNFENPDYKIKVINWIDANKSNLFNSGFEAGKAKNQIDYLLKKEADVILPVAGPQFRDLISELKNQKKAETKIIGVDVDQHKNVDKEFKSRYLTSILKNIKDTFYYANKIFIEKDKPANLWSSEFKQKMFNNGDPKWGEAIYLSSDIGMTGITKLKDLPLFTGNITLKIDEIWKSVIDPKNGFYNIAKNKYSLKIGEKSGVYQFPWAPNKMTDGIINWIDKINNNNPPNFDFQ